LLFIIVGRFGASLGGALAAFAWRHNLLFFFFFWDGGGFLAAAA
jgi:hypothetical protein